jgi:hypothetical protein
MCFDSGPYTLAHARAEAAVSALRAGRTAKAQGEAQ